MGFYVEHMEKWMKGRRREKLKLIRNCTLLGILRRKKGSNRETLLQMLRQKILHYIYRYCQSPFSFLLHTKEIQSSILFHTVSYIWCLNLHCTNLIGSTALVFDDMSTRNEICIGYIVCTG